MARSPLCQGITSEHKICNLNVPFAREMVIRHYGKELADLIYSMLPLYKRGKNKGEVKGALHWDKVTHGGWDYKGGGGIVAKGTRNVGIRADWDTYDRHAVIGTPGTFSRLDESLDEQRASVIRGLCVIFKLDEPVELAKLDKTNNLKRQIRSRVAAAREENCAAVAFMRLIPPDSVGRHEARELVFKGKDRWMEQARELRTELNALI